MALVAGDTLGPYEIIASLGAGGMGEVYRAKDRRLGREVAIKILPERLSMDPNALSRFEREARALATLSHINVLSIFDVGSERGISYVVTELLKGETLRQRIHRSPLTWRKAIEFAIAISDGLAAAHAKGVIHRDLKPENIFITTDEQLKILDFGLARRQKTQESQDLSSAPTEIPTESGIVMGTVPYMSPEQARGKEVDSRTDIFSFGCILYEMLSGRRPFARDTNAETVAAILKEEPPQMNLPEGAPLELEGILSHCLEKNADHRFQSARDLAFQLRQILPRMTSTQSISAVRSAPRFPQLKIVGFIAVVVIVGILLLFKWKSIPKPESSSPPIRSLAVMPLTNFSGDPNQDYFADGMTEALITDLAQIKSLKVISRTSVMQYKGTKKTLKEIAGELKVDGIVEGSVVRSGNRIRITAQLIQASSDQHLWAESYERDAYDILSLQSEVASAVAREIKAALTPEEEQHLVLTRKINPEVHELYLKARYLTSKGTENDLKTAVNLLKSAIEKDPEIPLLYVGLATAYAAFADWYLAPAEVMPQSKEAATKALSLDNNSSEAHTALGIVQLLYDYDWNAAETSFKRAIELNANNADAYHWYSVLCAILTRKDEASSLLRKAHELDPLNPMVNMDAIWILFLGRDYELSIQFGRKALEIDPGFAGYYFMLSPSLQQTGDSKQAVSMAEKAVRLYDTPMIQAILAQQYAISGKTNDAEAILYKLLEIAKKRYVCPYEMAVIYLNLKQIDSAFQWLEKSFNERSMCIIYLKSDPRLDSIRSDQRFQDLLRKMRFPD